MFGSDDRRRLAGELMASLGLARDEDVPVVGRASEPSAAELLRRSKTESVAAGEQKRVNRRFAKPSLRVMIMGYPFVTANWSLGGVLVDRYAGDARQKMRFAVVLSDAQRIGVYHAASARVIRHDPRGRALALHFEKLSESGFEWLNKLQLQLRGHA